MSELIYRVCSGEGFVAYFSTKKLAREYKAIREKRLGGKKLIYNGHIFTVQAIVVHTDLTEIGAKDE